MLCIEWRFATNFPLKLWNTNFGKSKWPHAIEYNAMSIDTAFSDSEIRRIEHYMAVFLIASSNYIATFTPKRNLGTDTFPYFSRRF